MKKRFSLSNIFNVSLIALCMLSLSIIFSVIVQAQDKILIYDNKEHIYTGEEVKLRIDQTLIKYNGMYPVIINDRTLVPIREVMESEQIGATVTYVDKSKPILIQKGDMSIEITINSKLAKINGVETTLDVPALLIRDKSVGIDKTMVPIRFITEALGYVVDWDSYNREVVLTSNERELLEFSTVDSNLTRIKGTNPLAPLLPTPLNANPIKLFVPTQGEYVKLVDQTNEASFPDTEIVEVISNVSETRFYIRSKSSMSTIDYSFWDQKVVIDIEGLIMGNFPTVIRMDNGVYAQRVRTSQYNENPKKGRIVFDLYNNAVPKEVNISSDRTQIELVFNEVGLSDVTIAQDLVSDYILLKGNYADYSMLRLESPNRMLIDLKNTVDLLGKKEQKFINGQEIKSLKIGQFTYDVTRLVIETADTCDYTFDYDDVLDVTQIRVKPTNFRQIEMNKIINDLDTSIELTIPNVSYLPELITTEENLATFSTQLIFPTIIPELSQEESIFVGDGYINNLTVKIVEGKSVVTVIGNHILEFSSEQKEQGYTFIGKRPKDLYPTIVVIDIGHGGSDPGASYNGLIEKEVNLKIGQYFKSFITYDSKIKYYFTREVDKALSLQSRVDIANDLEADFMLAIHNNAIDISKDPSKVNVNGLEILTTINETKSDKEIAIANGLYDALKNQLPNINYRGVRDYSKLFILRYTKMPAIIVEYAFLTNVQDSTNLKDEAILSEMARITQSYLQTQIK